MAVLGIDLSRLAVDLVVLQDDGPQAEWLRIPLTGDPVTSARLLRHTFPRRGWHEDRGIHHAAIEDPFSDRPHTAKALGRITGAVLALLPPELELTMIAPQTWRKEFLGTAKAAKEDAWTMLLEQWPGAYEAWLPELRRHHRRRDRIPHDAADAYAVAYAARAIDNRRRALAAAEEAA